MIGRDCQRQTEPPLYRCNRWDCKSCLRLKLYWLRERGVQFVTLQSKSDLYFTTLKNFKDTHEAKDMMDFIIAREKSLKKPHKSKFEYFYVISKHNFSEWHIHIISNRQFEPQAAYSKPVEKLKAAALYLVANLELSAREDYSGVRRYGGSSLLYKQSPKKRFKNRINYWLLIVRLSLVRVLNFVTLLLWYRHWKAARPLPYRVDLGNWCISQSQRNHRGITEEFTFRRARDDLVGESDSG